MGRSSSISEHPSLPVARRCRWSPQIGYSRRQYGRERRGWSSRQPCGTYRRRLLNGPDCLGYTAGMDAGMLADGKWRRSARHIGARRCREITGHTALQTLLHPAEAISRSDGSGHASRQELHPASQFYRMVASTSARPWRLTGCRGCTQHPPQGDGGLPAVGARRDPAAVAAGTAERGRDSSNHLLEDQLRRPGLGIPLCGLPAPGGGSLRPYAS